MSIAAGPEEADARAMKALNAEASGPAAEPPAAVASVEPAPETAPERTGPAPAMAAAAGDEPLEDLKGSLAELFDPLLAPLTGEQAASLLKQHRLVVRVRATDMSLLLNPERVASRLSRAPVSAGWQVEGEAPRQVASLVASPFPSVAPRAHGPEPVVIVGRDGPGAVAGAPQASYVGPAASLADLLPEGPRVYLLRARAEASALEGLRASLNARGMTAEFEIAPEALPVGDDPALDAAAVLWWTQKPAGWAGWGRVPVVVDVERGG
jgi:hypothetical protein